MAYIQIPAFSKTNTLDNDTEFVIVVDGIEYLVTFKTLSDKFGNTPELLQQINAEIEALRNIVDALPTENPAAPIALKIADTPTIDGIYKPTETGVYPNAGGLEYDPTDGITYFIRTNGVWTKDVTPINFTPTGVVEEGNTQAVSGGEVFSKLSGYLNKEETGEIVRKSTPDTLYNDIKNGDFKNNDNWIPTFTGSDIVVNNNQLSVIVTNSANAGFQQNIGRPKQGDVLYFSFNYMFPEFLPYSMYVYTRLGFSSPLEGNLVTGKEVGVFNFGSNRIVVNNPVLEDVAVAVRVTGISTPEPQTRVVVSNFTYVNLTEAFGAGNEPSKAEMDSFIKSLDNSWIDYAVKKPTNTNQYQQGMYLKNLVNNGNMAIVDSSTGLATGFTKGSSVTSSRVENNTQYFTASNTALSGSLTWWLADNFIIDDLYYISAKIENVSRLFVDNIIPSYYNKGLYSFVFTPNRENFNQIRVQPSYADVEASISNLVLINLTKTFGKGNEPSRDEMDRMLSEFPDRWFQGNEPQQVKSIENIFADFSKEIFNDKYKLKISSIPYKEHNSPIGKDIYPVLFGVKMFNKKSDEGYNSHNYPIGWLYYIPEAPYKILYASGTPDNPKEIFTWDMSITPTNANNPNGLSPEFYSPMICKNGDIIFVFRTEKSSGFNRSNPIIYKAEDNYQNPEIIDFSGKPLIPCAWLQNCGAEYIYDHDFFVFAEYVRPWSGSANVWKVTQPFDNPDNWRVTLSKDLTEVEHLHTANYDPFSDDIYVTSGDSDPESNVWRSSDFAETWELVSHGDQGDARVLNFIFTKDFAYWGTDAGKHLLWKAPRDVNNNIDFSKKVILDDLNKYGRGVTYATVLIDDPYGILILRHIDTATYDPIAVTFYDLKTGDTHVLKMMTQIDDGNPPNEYGFRNESVNFYTSPATNKVVIGFGFKPNYFDLLGNKKGENIDILCNLSLEVF